MHKNTRDITGLKFNSLTALEKVDDICNRVAWLFECDCGKKKKMTSTNVVGGRSTTCGCSKKGTHGHSGKPEYHAWYSMIERCTKSDHRFWNRYGGRGIKVCDNWLNSIDSFLRDMGRRPSKKHQLDRIDNNKGYNKNNCHWVLPAINLRNRSDSKYWFVDGVKYDSMSHAAEETGISRSTVHRWCVKKMNNCYSEAKYK